MNGTIINDFSSNLDKILNSISSWLGQHLFNILLILLVGWIARIILSKMISKSLQSTVIRHDLYPTEIDRKRRAKTLNSLITALIRFVIWIVVIIMIIGELGIDTAPLIASAGVMGIALGFGAQSLIRDLVSGIFIIVENQFRIGDVVKLATTGTPMVDIVGTVEEITIRSTVIRDLNGELIHVPNGVINVTINKTVGFAQLNEEIIVKVDTDLERLEHVINHVGKQIADSVHFEKKIITAPHFERVKGFNNDGIVILIRGKTKPGDQWVVSGELFKRLKKAFETNKIEMSNAKKK